MHDTRCGCWDGRTPFLSVEECYENFSEFNFNGWWQNEVDVVSHTLEYAPCIFVHTKLP
jgi:hypothetical protein